LAAPVGVDAGDLSDLDSLLCSLLRHGLAPPSFGLQEVLSRYLSYPRLQPLQTGPKLLF
jgi:hypothetical protein